jgi:thiol-disulfide isomerase/thioredoxin
VLPAFARHSLIVLAVLAAAGCNGGVKRQHRRVPDAFHALTLTDDPLDRSTLVGRPWVISAWRPGCEPCMRQLKTLDAVKQRVDGVSFVALSLEDDEDAILEAAGRAEVDSALAVAEAASAASLGLKQLPSTVFIDADATVLAQVAGECDDATVEQWARAARQ